MSWSELEEKVREIASWRWNCKAIAETIAGVQCDCVLKPEWDSWVAVEITEEKNLEKVRADILKLDNVRRALMSQNIYCKCFIVLKDTPTNSMRSTGDAQKIKIMSVEEFETEYFNYKGYVHVRSQKHFGSLVNIDTGAPEKNVYVSVSYLDKKSRKEYKINDIIERLRKGWKIILKGDFGLGKSRCIKQIFDVINEETIRKEYVIAVNLREHWGAKRGIEILTRHFEELGLDAKTFIKNYEHPNVIYLLDGFDEIGTQSWSSDRQKMQHIREMSVCALKDLVNSVKGGVLIAGRDYYFNSDKEMLNCLGLKEERTIILECHDEFTDSELYNYIMENLPDNVKRSSIGELPSWFPKRPLVIQLLFKYASEIFSVEYPLEDICSFWYEFLTRICEREAKIYPALNPEVIKQVLLNLANKTRLESANTGPITQTDLSNAFQIATGFQPSDESAIMLQRLPSLGRISADSQERQFLDLFILNGLRAEAIIQAIKSWDLSAIECTWKNPLNSTGYMILTEYIAKDEKRVNTFLNMARRAADSKNPILASDIVAAIGYLETDVLNYKNLTISDGHFTELSFEGKDVKNLHICHSVIEKLDITNARLDETILIEDCVISTIYGITSNKSMPAQIVNCSVENFEKMATTNLIKKARLTTSQKIFVAMIRKIFYQPGAGRKEETLLRGMGMAANKHCAEKILNKLLDEKIVTRHRGDEGYIYKPVRSCTAQMDKILTELTLCKDPLWETISNIS